MTKKKEGGERKKCAIPDRWRSNFRIGEKKKGKTVREQAYNCTPSQEKKGKKRKERGDFFASFPCISLQKEKKGKEEDGEASSFCGDPG